MVEGQPGWGRLAADYLAMGIEHILLGVDHLAFVAGLLLLVRGWGRLVKTITAFTVAHSLSLALAVAGVVRVPPGPVEAAIALSIAYLAVEVVYAVRGRRGWTVRYPWMVAFGFGLLHGLGFAGALTGLGLPPREIPWALLFFNLGVEAGQLLFVGFWLTLGWARRTLEFKTTRWARLGPAYAIGSLALVWFFQRFEAWI